MATLANVYRVFYNDKNGERKHTYVNISDTILKEWQDVTTLIYEYMQDNINDFYSIDKISKIVLE